MFYEDALGILVTLFIAVTKYPRNGLEMGGLALACGFGGWNLSCWEGMGERVRILKLCSSEETQKGGVAPGSPSPYPLQDL